MGMREEFEAWANDKGFCLDCRFFEEGNNFEDPDTALAFEIWEASRAALVVELPPVPYRQNPDPDTDHAMIERAAIRKACDAAGVTYK